MGAGQRDISLAPYGTLPHQGRAGPASRRPTARYDQPGRLAKVRTSGEFERPAYALPHSLPCRWVTGTRPAS